MNAPGSNTDRDHVNSQSKYSDIRNIPQRSASNDMPSQSAPVKKEGESRQSSSVNVAAPSADKTSAAASKSTIDVNAIPVHAASGKPITQVNIDEGWFTRLGSVFDPRTNMTR